MKKTDRKVRCQFCFHEWTVGNDEDVETVRVKCPKCSEWQTFGEGRREWRETAEFQFQGKFKIRRRSSGISISWTTREKEIVDGKETGDSEIVEHEESVIHGWILPKRRLIVENEYPYYEIELRHGKPEILTGSQIADRLKLEGRILHRKSFPDVLTHLLRHFCAGEDKANATYGIYQDDEGKLYVDETPVGLSDEQRTAFSEIEPGLRYSPTAEDFQQYINFNTHFKPVEILPAMALSVMATMSQPIRSHNRMLPHLYHVGPPGTSGLGKSSSQRGYVVMAWGRHDPNVNSLESKFRLPAHLDAYCGPQVIGEASGIDLEKIGSMLKNSAEGWLLTKRGDASKGAIQMIPYFSRETLFLSGNTFNIREPAQLVRFFCIIFDAANEKEKNKNKLTFDRVMRALKPVGPPVARKIPEMWPTWQAFDDEKMRLEAEIGDCYEKVYNRTWADLRRPEEWSFVLMGLMAWKKAFDDSGVDWRLPTVDEFVRTIVMPVEEMTFRASRTPLEYFDIWFLDFISMNVLKAQINKTRIEKGNYDETDEETTYDYTPKGMGETWERGALEVDGVRRPGVWVTSTILERYNRDSALELRFDSLRSLADTVSRVRDLPLAELVEENGLVKRVSFSVSGRQRAVFIPVDIGEIRTPEFEKRRKVKLKVPLDNFSYGGTKYNGKDGEILELVSDLAAQLVSRNWACYVDGEGEL